MLYCGLLTMTKDTKDWKTYWVTLMETEICYFTSESVSLRINIIYNIYKNLDSVLTVNHI